MQTILKRTNAVNRLLRAAAAHALVVVAAPAGYGKTTVARELARNGKMKSLLFSVRENSDDAERLWDDLWRELDAENRKNARQLRRMGLPKSAPQMRRAAALLDASGTTVILDDYHHCAAREIDAFIESLARRENGKSRVILFSRTLPEIAAETFDQELLAFTEYEAKRYFLDNGVTDMTIAESSWKYSEGWPAALWLCLQNCRDGNAAPPSGDPFGDPFRDIETLLEKVVYSAYPEEIQRLLVQLSLLDSFTPAEAAAVSEDPLAGRRLAALRSRNAFISREPARAGYHFHGIFRDFLQKKLAERPDLNQPGLYRRTAECHAARREFPVVYGLLDRAGREEDKVRLLRLLREQCGAAFPDCRQEELYAAVRAIPWRLRFREPLGYISFLWYYINYGAAERNLRMLREAEKRFANAKSIPPENRRRILGELEYMRGVYAFNDARRMVKHYRRAGELLDGASFLAYDQLSWTYSSPHMTWLLLREDGDYKNLLDAIDKDLNCVTRLTGGDSDGGEAMARAEYHLERGELDEAEELLSGIREQANWRNETTLYLLALFAWARLLLARGRLEEANALFRDSAGRFEKKGYFEHLLCHNIAWGYISACLGRTGQVPAWLLDERVFVQPYNQAQSHSFVLAVHGKLLLARGDFDALAGILEKTGENLGPFEQLFGRLHRRILSALAAKKRGDSDAALEQIRAAVDLSRPDGIVLPFAEYGGAVQPLLRRLRKSCPEDAHLERLADWCGRSMRPLGEKTAYKKSLLTPREKLVMRLVAKEGRTTPSIARHLGVSQSAVKLSLSAAYLKLGARGRVDAAKKFNALGETIELARPDGRVLSAAEYGAECGEAVSPIPGSLKKARAGDGHVEKNLALSGRIRKIPAKTPAGAGALSSRERETMRLVAKGLSNRAIGEKLGITRHTVRRNLNTVYAKLGVSNRIRAARLFSGRNAEKKGSDEKRH